MLQNGAGPRQHWQTRLKVLGHSLIIYGGHTSVVNLLHALLLSMLCILVLVLCVLCVLLLEGVHVLTLLELGMLLELLRVRTAVRVVLLRLVVLRLLDVCYSLLVWLLVWLLV